MKSQWYLSRPVFSVLLSVTLLFQLLTGISVAAADATDVQYLTKEPYDTLPQETEKDTRSVPWVADWGADKPSGTIKLDNGWLAYVQNNGTSKSGKDKGAQSEAHIPLVPGSENDLKVTPQEVIVEFDWKTMEKNSSIYIRDDKGKNVFRLYYNGSKITYQFCNGGGTPSGTTSGKSVNLTQGATVRLELNINGGGHAVIQKAWVNQQDEGISSVSNSTLTSGGYTVLILAPKGNTPSLYSTVLCALDNLRVWEPVPEQTKADMTVVGGSKIAAGGRMNVNLHLLSQGTEADAVEFDLKYDPALLSYLEVQKGWSSEGLVDLTVSDDKNGIIHIKATDKGKGLPRGTVSNYAATRIAKLDFAVADIKGEVKASQVTVENIVCKKLDENIESSANQSTPLRFSVYPGNVQDLNGDGVIGAGDIAMATDLETQKAIAPNAKIQPYKRVLTIVTDGAGNSFHPGTGTPPHDGPYYVGTKTIEEARAGSEFGMWLHNEYMATSYSAAAIDPPSSCQNYNTFLHGVGTYGAGSTVPEDYKIDNDIAHANYYPDFGKAEPKYPSIYKVINDVQPSRKLAGFAQYASIMDGVAEIDSGAYTRRGTGKNGVGPDEQMADEIVEYIQNGEMKDTAFTFYVLDDMDGYGHLASSDGWFGDKYYETQNTCSRCYEKVFRALEQNDMLDDTLLISTADHGGTAGGHAHGNNSRLDNTTIYFGIGGQTVDNSKRLTGGETTGLGAIVLGNLGFELPESMKLSKDFTKTEGNNAFLSQEELSRKNRDVEQVRCYRSGKTAKVSLKNPKQENQVQVVDFILEGQTPAKVDTEGSVLYQNGNHLILSFEHMPDEICTLTYSEDVTEQEKISQVMLGTSTGKEIYCDLYHTADAWSFTAGGKEVSALKEAKGAELTIECAQEMDGKQLLVALYDENGILVQFLQTKENTLSFTVPATGVTRIKSMVWSTADQTPCADAGILE